MLAEMGAYAKGGVMQVHNRCLHQCLVPVSVFDCMLVPAAWQVEQ